MNVLVISFLLGCIVGLVIALLYNNWYDSVNMPWRIAIMKKNERRFPWLQAHIPFSSPHK